MELLHNLNKYVRIEVEKKTIMQLGKAKLWSKAKSICRLEGQP